MDAGTQAIVTAVFSPAAIAGALWYILDNYAKKQAALLGKISKDVAALGSKVNEATMKIALVEQKAAIVEELRVEMKDLRLKVAMYEGLREDVRDLHEKLIKAQSQIDAAWRNIDAVRK